MFTSSGLLLKRDTRPEVRLAVMAGFVLLTAISAKVSIPLEPVPFTLQPMAVLFTGMMLGGRDGFLAQLAYVLLIALGAPIDARGIGSAALFSPTGGYLVGFVVAAGVTGLLTARIGGRVLGRFLAGLVGVVVIYAFGATHLVLYTGMDWGRAWASGVAPFLVWDAVKAFLAGGLSHSLRRR